MAGGGRLMDTTPFWVPLLQATVVFAYFLLITAC
jgi:hypothetical protein